MGREVRMVPAEWLHPKRENGRYVPLFDGYSKDLKAWEEKWRQYGDGEPCREDYMPDFPQSERTHYQMYETTSEGTPISPVCETPEELARWLADNNASAFASLTATYEQWLAVIKRCGFAPSAVMSGGSLESGVSHLGQKAIEEEDGEG